MEEKINSKKEIKRTENAVICSEFVSRKGQMQARMKKLRMKIKEGKRKEERLEEEAAAK
ncbi:hypothetical protein CCACVL1_08552, partial [Corchorus capsularis]